MGISKKTMETKYLVFTSTDGNKKVVAKFTKVWDGIKDLIEATNGGKEGEYEKDFIKIKFNSHDNLPLNKMLKRHTLTVMLDLLLKKMVNIIQKSSYMNGYLQYKC